MSDQTFFLVRELAKKNHIQLDWEEVKVQLLSHPFYPSLNSITDLFNHFDIPAQAFRADRKTEVYFQAPQSFLAEIHGDRSTSFVIVSKKDKYVEVVYDEHKSKRMKIENFIELWTGILLVTEKTQNPGGHNSNIKTNKIRYLYFSTLIIFSSLFLQANPTVFEIIYLVLSFLGVYISYLIVKQEIGIHSSILDKVCSGETKNCNSVLNSNGSKIIGLFSLSDLGIVYFITLSFGLILSSLLHSQTNAVFFITSTLAISITPYSIIYQWKVAKGWCNLCLSIVGILWLQFAISFYILKNWESIFIIDLSSSLFFASLLITTSLWVSVKPLLKKEQKFEKLKIEHLKFKRDLNLFKAALNFNPQIETDISSGKELVFGNKIPTTPIEIVFITNPMCGFCKESHQLLKEILKLRTDNIRVIVRFNVRTTNEEVLETIISARILELYNTTNDETCLVALSDIFSEMGANNWLEKWGKFTNKTYLITLSKGKEWCVRHNMNFTPELLVNGKQFPKEYEKIDLLYFLDDLIEEQEFLKNTQTTVEESIL